MSDNKSASGGVGLSGLLLVAFIVLKLCHVIDWNWWWVLSPLWIPIALCIPILLIGGIMIRRNNIDEKKRLEAGMSLWDWKYRNNEVKPEKPKSKWQQRMEEMQEKNKVK